MGMSSAKRARERRSLSAPTIEDAVKAGAMVEDLCQWRRRISPEDDRLHHGQKNLSSMLSSIIHELQGPEGLLVTPAEWQPLLRHVTPEQLDMDRWRNLKKFPMAWFRDPGARAHLPPSVMRLYRLVVARGEPRLVRWDEFLEAYRNVIRKWVRDLGTRPPPTRILLALSSEHPVKSSMWLFLLLLRELIQLSPPTARLLLERTYLVHSSALPVLRRPGDHLLVLDDAAYSGTQLLEEHLPRACSSEGMTASILLPYVSRYALQRMSRNLPGVGLYMHEVIPNLLDAWTPQEILKEDWVFGLPGRKYRSMLAPLSKMTLFVFEHKLADDISIPVWFSEGGSPLLDVLVRHRVELHRRTVPTTGPSWMRRPVGNMSPEEMESLEALLASVPHASLQNPPVHSLPRMTKIPLSMGWLSPLLCPPFPDSDKENCGKGGYRTLLRVSLAELPPASLQAFARAGFSSAIQYARRTRNGQET